MKAFIYQAALLCADCAETERERLTTETGTSRQLLETGTDSEGYPQGPYGDGGGEADCPQHCDHCGVFLENPLTPDGDTYVRNLAEEYETAPDMSWQEIAEAAEADGKQTLAEWIRYYFAWG